MNANIDSRNENRSDRADKTSSTHRKVLRYPDLQEAASANGRKVLRYPLDQIKEETPAVKNEEPSQPPITANPTFPFPEPESPESPTLRPGVEPVPGTMPWKWIVSGSGVVLFIIISVVCVNTILPPWIPTPTPSPTPTVTAEVTLTATPTTSPTHTATLVPTDTATPTPSYTFTPLPTDTPTSTHTPTATSSPTNTSTPTPTITFTPSSTPTPTPFPLCDASVTLPCRYGIQSGDNLSEIAGRFYSTSSLWQALCNYNIENGFLENCRDLSVGQEILLPLERVLQQFL